MLEKTAKKIPWFGDCSCLQHGNHLYSWEKITQKIGIHQECKGSHNETNKCSIISEKMVSDLTPIDWENSSWKYLSLSGDEIVISLQRTKVYVFSDSVSCLKKIFRKNPIFDNWLWANGTRAEHCTKINYVAAQSRSQKFTVEFGWNTREFQKKDYLPVDVQRHLMGIKTQENTMRVKC